MSGCLHLTVGSGFQRGEGQGRGVCGGCDIIVSKKYGFGCLHDAGQGAVFKLSHPGDRFRKMCGFSENALCGRGAERSKPVVSMGSEPEGRPPCRNEHLQKRGVSVRFFSRRSGSADVAFRLRHFSDFGIHAVPPKTFPTRSSSRSQTAFISAPPYLSKLLGLYSKQRG